MIDLTDLEQDEIDEFWKKAEGLRDQIIESKKQRERENIHRLNKIQVLRIAADYYEWLFINQRGTSFSTFVDEFGFDATLASEVYKRVIELFQCQGQIVFNDSDLYSEIDYPKPPYQINDGDDND